MPPSDHQNGDTLNSAEYTRKIDKHEADLEAVKKRLDDLDGKELDKKICQAIEDSTHIQDKIGVIVWRTLKEKIIWILLTLLGLMVWDLLKDWLGNFLTK